MIYVVFQHENQETPGREQEHASVPSPQCPFGEYPKENAKHINSFAGNRRQTNKQPSKQANKRIVYIYTYM